MAPKSASASGDKNLKSKSPAEFFQDNKGTSSVLNVCRAKPEVASAPKPASHEYFLNQMCEWASNPYSTKGVCTLFLSRPFRHPRPSRPVNCTGTHHVSVHIVYR